LCRSWNAETYTQLVNAIKPGIKHGTRGAYQHHGCRCDDCLRADREYNQKRRAENPRVREVRSAANARRRAADPEKYRQYERARKAKRKERTADLLLMRTYQLEPGEYDRRLQEQGGGCKICGKPPKKRRLDVDHCHGTGKVRGLLCSACNRGIGYFGDNPDLVSAAAAYLREA
jgi:hypothetical protein